MPPVKRSDIPAELVKAVQNRYVIPFAGAGVSRNVRLAGSADSYFPNWREFLTGVARTLERSGRAADAGFVRACVEVRDPKFLDAAQHAQDVAPALWYEHLESQFGKDLPRDAEGLELAQALWRIADNLVITTNFDRVLRVAHQQPEAVREVVSEASTNLVRFCSGSPGHPTVWHLHGNLSSIQHLILTCDTYELLWPSENGRREQPGSFVAARAVLASLLLQRSLLFVGSSMEDVLLSELSDVSRKFGGGGPPHFALVPTRAEFELLRERCRRFEVRNLEVLAAEDFGCTPAELLDRVLAESVPRAPRHTLFTLWGDDLEMAYDHRATADGRLQTSILRRYQALRTAESELCVPVTFNFAGNERRFGAKSRIVSIQVRSLTDGVTAVLEPAFTAIDHDDVYEGDVRFRSSAGEVTKASFEILARVEGGFTTRDERDDFRWISTAAFDHVRMTITWNRPLAPEVTRMSYWRQDGALEEPVTGQLVVDTADDWVRWTFEKEDVLPQARYTLSWRMRGGETSSAPAASAAGAEVTSSVA